MDDSDQDFADLCSKLLKRVRKKPAEARQPAKVEARSSSQASQGDKRRRNNRNGDCGSKLAASQPVNAPAEQPVVGGRTGLDSGEAGPSVTYSETVGTAAVQGSGGGLRAKDKVLLKMQQFKRASPQRMLHADRFTPANHHSDRAPFAQQQGRDNPETLSSGARPKTPDSDEVLAQRLQQELDREAAQARTGDLEDRGLFFCQICHRDLSHMSPNGRTQHLNRCLDESEDSAPARPPPPGVPECPICGKKFKSQKSRSAHLKRCSAEMGVSSAELLQALQRQAVESRSTATANPLMQTAGTKRKGPSKPALPASKKPRKKTKPMDEETMVALALSSSLLEQERKQLREEEEAERQTEAAAAHTSMTSLLKWRPDTGKGRGKRKKGAVPRAPPLLLVQDAEVALRRLQDRVSALLLLSPPPSPPTPTRCTSTLPGWTGAAPLWQKSALMDDDSDFYVPELREFLTPPDDAVSFDTCNKPESSVQPEGKGTPVRESRDSILLSSSKVTSCSPAASTPGTTQLPVGSQTLKDLMELTEEGITLTQYGKTAKDQQTNAGLSANIRLSGFIPEEAAAQDDLGVSGFVPEMANTHSKDAHGPAERLDDQARADHNRGSHQSAALSRLASDLSSMVNNPQLSDVQLQVDSGEVYFAHSFMVYARCPLLAEMVHESGFGVQEEGMPASQRVLMSDVPGEAVFTLLRYLYTARCSIPASLRPHVLELASRFDLQELQQLCQLHREEADDVNQEENVCTQTDEAFTELLRSMWNDGEEDGDGVLSDGGRDEENCPEEDCLAEEVMTRNGEICEERVNEEELEEIYEFAATQRQREEKDSEEEEEEEEEERVDGKGDEEAVFTKLAEPKNGKSQQSNFQLETNPSLDRSYNRLFSDSWGVCEEGEPVSSASTSGPPKTDHPQSQQHKSPPKPSSELSARALLQSSASAVYDISISPTHSASNLPFPGLSPGLVETGDAVGLDVPKEGSPLKRESQGPRSICAPLSPDTPQKKEEPELIVLSDSSDELEMEVDGAGLSPPCPLPHSPCSPQKIQSYTEVKSRRIQSPIKPTSVNKESISFQFSPGDPPDCSPEVSWLIPSTPPVQSTRSGSTQTKSSMCRTQLFPKGRNSALSSSDFSSPALPFKLHTSSSPVCAHVDPAGGRVSRLRQDGTGLSSSRLDLSGSPKKSSSFNLSRDRDVFAVPLSQPKLSNLSDLTNSTPLHLKQQPYSSTPLHTDLHQPPVLSLSSSLSSDTDTHKLSGQRSEGAPSESLEKTESGSFHLSPLSGPSDPPSSSSNSGLQSSKRKSSSQSPRSVRSSRHDDAGVKLMRREGTNEEGERHADSGDEDRGDRRREESKGGSGEADNAESSYNQSFMDEPPMAFNDSWGLDVGVEANPGRFSLRLEDSGRSSQQERSPGQRGPARSSTSPITQPPPPSSHSVRTLNSCNGAACRSSRKGDSPQAQTNPSSSPSPPDPNARATPEVDNGLLDSKIWESWEEEGEEEEALPLFQRVNPSVQRKTPVSSHNKRRRTMVPITPMPHYSDMDTPELKNKVSRFGIRPLPKRQMILKLKEIHQYTHQLVSSDSEDEAPPAAQMKPPPGRTTSCAQTVKFKEPTAPAVLSPLKQRREEEEAEPLSASQGSNASSTAASEESERSNPELCISSEGDSDSDGGISCSQAASRLQDRLLAVRSFILSDPGLYSQILQYQPLVLSQLQQRLKAAGIRLGAAKLVDYLDSQCITFTTAKPGHSAPGRRRAKQTRAAGDRGASRKKAVTALI
ncbi:structure-specific endonuclease subunit SLX4 isoform X2 [Mugil cephalus]|uniref:structure-specific endonuclease subunit SLX4 isoform X2 n=1 Tax=Mugil cephalus TaxID=48193 RepID=UPI001FB5FF1F|nr:structure-specific endonuclease subunit SLX4 isoform X2 [Mugil cephalus]